MMRDRVSGVMVQ